MNRNSGREAGNAAPAVGGQWPDFDGAGRRVIAWCGVCGRGVVGVAVVVAVAVVVVVVALARRLAIRTTWLGLVPSVKNCAARWLRRPSTIPTTDGAEWTGDVTLFTAKSVARRASAELGTRAFTLLEDHGYGRTHVLPHRRVHTAGSTAGQTARVSLPRHVRSRCSVIPPGSCLVSWRA